MRRDALPPVLVLTDRLAARRAGRSLTEVVEALRGSPALLVYREKDLEPDARRELGSEVMGCAGELGVVVASDLHLALELGALGVHLSATDPRPSSRGLIVGRSCHDRGELAAARCDYATLSPVHPTSSKPGYGPTLGIDGLTAVMAGFPGRGRLPVFALGGIAAGDAGPCVGAGAFGVAVMGSAMTAPEPRALVEQLAAEVLAARTSEEVPG
ncbi:MAG: Thiamine-phosphate synthase [Acidimicrobiales bacterium]|nr:MAG: thiamine phosphate synthase [Actinomycetota bacterium]MBV6508138.1 Thiamine-phosphate synthase [Acidimicrobiales bacterium]RIK03883.1 MAG: thiamine phosphate synthase [Acidobacteriota bacterium]